MENTKFPEYLDSLRADATRKSYKWGISWVLGDLSPDRFLEICGKDRRRAENIVIDFIKRERDRIRSATLRGPIAALKSFLDYWEISLNWKRIKATLPISKRIANDRAPELEEIQKLLTVCDSRMKSVVLILASSGIRVGAFEGMKVKDLEFRESGLGLLWVYRNSPDEYFTFTTPEAYQTVKEYLKEREKIGEIITPDSPLMRDKWDYTNRRRSRPDPKVPGSVSPKSLANTLLLFWVKAGVREYTRNSKYERREFQQVHGFRKFFKSQLRVMRESDSERLMGHRTHYERQTLEDLEKEYIQKALPVLTISQAERDKIIRTPQLKNLEEKVKRLQEEKVEVQVRSSSQLNEIKERLESLEKTRGYQMTRDSEGNLRFEIGAPEEFVRPLLKLLGKENTVRELEQIKMVNNTHWDKEGHKATRDYVYRELERKGLSIEEIDGLIQAYRGSYPAYFDKPLSQEEERELGRLLREQNPAE